MTPQEQKQVDDLCARIFEEINTEKVIELARELDGLLLRLDRQEPVRSRGKGATGSNYRDLSLRSGRNPTR